MSECFEIVNDWTKATMTTLAIAANTTPTTTIATNTSIAVATITSITIATTTTTIIATTISITIATQMPPYFCTIAHEALGYLLHLKAYTYISIIVY
mgnify:FL=1